MKKGNLSSHKILLCSLLGVLATLLFIYLGFTIYFSNHFFFHTEINGINASCLTAKEMDQQFSDEVKIYQLQLNGRNDITDTISADQINLTYTPNENTEKALAKQSPLLWPGSIFKKDTFDIPCGVNYDETLLKNLCSDLAFFQEENVLTPVNATIAYLKNQGYYIINEDPGATVKKKVFLNNVKQSISTLDENLSLDLSGCYKEAAIKSDSKKIVKLYKKLQNYGNTQITYTFGNKTELLDGNQIHKWITINQKKAKASISEDKVRAYVEKLSAKYDTYGRTRTFKSSTGNNVSVSGGDYGWLINKDEETAKLIKLINKGAVKTRTPIYTRKGHHFGKKDWGNTYVEVNLSKQHLWFYKNGKLIIDSALVSGCVRNGNSTPSGVYSVIYKKTNYVLGVLSNAPYRTFVHYWMPFNGGIGLHDAYWRRSFGGNIYQTSGSHGCINLPSSTAATIYNNIDVGTPVICYFE